MPKVQSLQFRPCSFLELKGHTKIVKDFKDHPIELTEDNIPSFVAKIGRELEEARLCDLIPSKSGAPALEEKPTFRLPDYHHYLFFYH